MVSRTPGCSCWVAGSVKRSSSSLWRWIFTVFQGVCTPLLRFSPWLKVPSSKRERDKAVPGSMAGSKRDCAMNR
ncbi:hypothetical protein D3C73_1317590 [compost metagenome]